MNYRLAPKHPFPAQIIDVKKAIAWTRENIASYGGDPSYLVITGGSRRRPPRRARRADPRRRRSTSRASRTPTPASPGACRSTASTTSPASPATRHAVAMRDYFLGPRVFQKDPARTSTTSCKASPLAHVSPDAPDFFVLHGANDSPGRRRPGAGVRRRSCEEESKATVTYAEFPGTQHAFEVFGSIRSHHVIKAVERWLLHHRAALPSARRRPEAEAVLSRGVAPGSARPRRCAAPAWCRRRSTGSGSAAARAAPRAASSSPVNTRSPSSSTTSSAESCRLRTPTSLATLDSGPGPCPASERSVARVPSSATTVASATARPTVARGARSRVLDRRAAAPPARRESPRREPGHRDPLVGQRRPGQPPAAVDLADHAVVGHEDVVEEDLVEHRLAGQLAQRPDVDARARHVDEEVGDAGVLLRVGVRCGPGRCPSRPRWASEVQTFWPVSRQPDRRPSRDPSALRAQRREVGAGAGLAEQLAPRDLAAQRRADEPLALLVGAVLEDRRRRPGADLQVGPLDAGRGELLVDDQLLHRVGAEPVRRRPVRGQVAGLGQGGPALVLGQGGDPLAPRSRTSVAAARRRPVEVDLHGAADAGRRRGRPAARRTTLDGPTQARSAIARRR